MSTGYRFCRAGHVIHDTLREFRASSSLAGHMVNEERRRYSFRFAGLWRSIWSVTTGMNADMRSEIIKLLPGDSPTGDGTPLSELEQRQEAILQRLAQLQQDVQKLSTEAGIPLLKSSPVCTSCPPAQSQSGVIQDIVVNADPDKPPLSLFILLKLLAQSTKILTTAHVHSSVTNINSHLREVFMNGPQGMRTDYQFAVTLVWKKEDHSPSMMVDPHKQSQVVGEANIARYLARLFMSAYDRSDPVQSTLVDTWLDMATHQLLQGNSKEKAAAVRNLNSRLGKNEWLVGSSMSLADIVVWSALQQVGLKQDTPANVQKWILSCHNLPEFQLPAVLSH